MRQLTGISLFAVLLAACSTTATDGGTTTGGGTTAATTGGTTTGASTTGGSSTGCGGNVITVTINSVDLFPPASQWLTANNLPVPNIFDAGFSLVVDGVHLDLSTGSAVLTTLASQPLIDAGPGPYTFTIDAGLTGIYDLGLLAAVGPTVTPDGGTVEPQLTCAQLAQAIDAGVGALGGAYFDYFIPAGNQPPPALANAVAGCYTGTVYGLPATFIAQLSCAAGVSTDDGGILATGIALVYFTEAPYGTGTPVAGASIANVSHGQPNGQAYYYSNDFAAGSQTPPTDATGVAALTAVVNPPPGLPPSFNVSPPAGGPAWLPISVQTNPGAVLEVIPIVP